MANLIRSAKSASDWTLNERLAYHIRVQAVPPEVFFHSDPLANPSLDHLDQALLTSPPGASGPELSDPTVLYLGYLSLATTHESASSIADFARETLALLGFALRTRLILSTHYTIPLTICGSSTTTARTAVCLLHRPATLVLLVVVTHRESESESESNTTIVTDPHAQAVAAAIAAYQFNARTRADLGLEPLQRMVIPCISMAGTRPTFYLVPVTAHLSTAVATGQYPACETVVSMCECVASGDGRGMGMADTEYRRVALGRLLALRTLARRHWEGILDGVDSLPG
ncbi:hypothetical protein B0H13DRAFT_1650215 [Mycena leptocephala]|nr:hypothetical protein B0H13DRAFT_1650215 [Mycena leptocephala]